MAKIAAILILIIGVYSMFIPSRYHIAEVILEDSYNTTCVHTTDWNNTKSTVKFTNPCTNIATFLVIVRLLGFFASLGSLIYLSYKKYW